MLMHPTSGFSKWSEKPMSSTTTNAEEDFEFAPIENSGKVNIANHSHEDVREHIYTVTVENGRAVSCTCPAHKYNAGSKHREAVENNTDVLATADPSLCSNGEENCPGPAAIDVESGPAVGDQFACFECWMDAFHTNEEADR
jgi:hypothetical protein